jgi:hypothetical protein
MIAGALKPCMRSPIRRHGFISSAANNCEGTALTCCHLRRLVSKTQSLQSVACAWHVHVRPSSEQWYLRGLKV